MCLMEPLRNPNRKSIKDSAKYQPFRLTDVLGIGATVADLSIHAVIANLHQLLVFVDHIGANV
jgi:hypothetical protein